MAPVGSFGHPVVLAAIRFKAVALMLLIHCLWVLAMFIGFCVVLCFALQYLMSILVLRSSWSGRESYCSPGIFWLLVFYGGSSLQCHGLVCAVCVWYFPVICFCFVFVALRPMSTDMVIAGRSVHLTTLFPGQAWASG